MTIINLIFRFSILLFNQMKRFIPVLFLVIFSATSAQNFSDRWLGHFSYLNVSDISEGENEIYVSAENAVFSYNLLTKEIKTVTTIDGLQGEIISTMHFSKDFNKLMIGYTNGLIEIFDPVTRDVRKVVDILNKQVIPPNQKRVNHFNETGNIIYVACQFGIVEYNIERLEFGDTFFIGTAGGLLNVTQTAVVGNQIFAATAGQGIKVADLTDPNLIDSAKWITRISGTWNGIVAFNNTVYAVRSNRQLWRFNGTAFVNTGFVHPQTLNDLKANDQFMTISTTRDVFVLNTGGAVQAQISNFENNTVTFKAGQVIGNSLFVGSAEKGLMKFDLPNVTTPEFIAPDGPIRNDSFAIRAAPEELWVVFGQYTTFFNPFPLDSRGISHLQKGEWLNIPFSELRNARDLSSINISPIDGKVYISSFHDGLLVLEDNQVVELFNNTNSGLESLSAAPDIRIHDTKFDSNGDLWVTNSRIERAIKVLRSNGQWQSFSVRNVISEPFLNTELAFAKMVIGRDGTKWIGSISNGLIGFNENNGTPQIKKLTEEEGNMPNNSVQAVALDNRNQLWIGTRRGLRVLFNTGGFFTDPNVQAEAVIILENGVPQELLFEQFITDIEVDGSNNKWIGTVDSGVFMLSPDGQRTLQRFTQDNSPLPSNVINDISIDEQTGRVYFATQRGLVSFLGVATTPKEDLNEVIVFPNPVKPDFNGNLTIRNLTRRAKVKITDISGNLVFETIAQGGTIEWDLRAFGRYKVASGVYMIIIINDDGSQTKVTKVMIIR